MARKRGARRYAGSDQFVVAGIVVFPARHCPSFVQVEGIALHTTHDCSTMIVSNALSIQALPCSNQPAKAKPSGAFVRPYRRRSCGRLNHF